jgi:hypothetical protein
LKPYIITSNIEEVVATLSHTVSMSVTRWRSQFRVRALNAHPVNAPNPLIGTCRNKAAQPHTTAIVV